MKLADTGLTAQDIKDKVNKYMIETYERFDFLAETAKDQYIYDEKGEKYLDFYAGIAVNSAGSCNEKVVEAVVNQAKTLMHTFNYPYTIPQALLAEKVCTTIGMDKIYFQNTGTEANEAMIKMARKYGIEKYGPNRYHIVTAKMGFHGRTFGSMSATGQPGNGCQVGFGPMTYGFSYAPYNDLKAPVRKIPSRSWWNRCRAKAAYIRRRRSSCRDFANSATRTGCCSCWTRCRPDGAGPVKS